MDNKNEELNEVIKHILNIPTTRDESNSIIWLIRGEKVLIRQFAVELVTEVENHLINGGYAIDELKEEPRHIEYELIDSMNEIIAYGEEVNNTVFGVKTPSHIVAFLELMEAVKEYL